MIKTILIKALKVFRNIKCSKKNIITDADVTKDNKKLIITDANMDRDNKKQVL